MGQVTVNVNGRDYILSCGDGEEEHLTSLARYVDNQLSELAQDAGQIGEGRLLLMTALVIADELSEALTENDLLKREVDTLKSGKAKTLDDAKASLSGAADRVETIAARLETP